MIRTVENGRYITVAWLIESRLKIAIATSAKQEEVEGLLSICGG